MKTIRLDIELYLQGCLGASLEEKGWMGNDGRRRQREREREKRERKKREREVEEMFTWFKLPTSRVNRSGVT
jgi:hypothetical protein